MSIGMNALHCEWFGHEQKARIEIGVAKRKGQACSKAPCESRIVGHPAQDRAQPARAQAAEREPSCLRHTPAGQARNDLGVEWNRLAVRKPLRHDTDESKARIVFLGRGLLNPMS